MIINNRTVVYLVSGLIALVLATNMVFGQQNVKILETSVLSILKTLAEANAPAPPDLGIENVVLRKVGEPTKKFNYYKYNATLVIHNYGGDLRNGRVVLNAGKDQKHSLVSNTESGFALDSGQTYIVRDYEVIFDGRYNGGEVEIELDLVDRVDPKKENNVYKLTIFEDDPKITGIGVNEILADGSVAMEFDATPFTLREHEFYVMTGGAADYEVEDLRYAEVETLGNLYGYHRVRNSLANLNEGFDEKEVDEIEAHEVKFSSNPFQDDEEHFVYVKAVNPTNGNYAVSNILRFGSQEGLTKAQGVKLLMEYADIEPFAFGDAYFEDVSGEDWYAEHIETLHNLGVIGSDSRKFSPDSLMTRSDALQFVMDYFNADLSVPDGEAHFTDVDSTHYLYPYVEGFSATAKASGLADQFKPGAKVTKDFLKYLVNEYRKSN